MAPPTIRQPDDAYAVLASEGAVSLRSLDDDLPTLVVDGDDTLWKCQERYEDIKMDFCSILEEAGIDVQGLIQKLDKLDARRAAATSNLTRNRFLESLLITYGYCCGTTGKEWKVEVERDIKRSWRKLCRPPELYPETLTFLERVSGPFNVILLTSGDKKIQAEKVRGQGIEFLRLLDAIYVVEKKTPKRLVAVLEEAGVDPDSAWVVGNGMRSDINPAREAGLNAIHIDRGQWEYEETIAVDQDFIRVMGLDEANQILDEKVELG